MQIKTTMIFYYTHVKMVNIWNTDDTGEHAEQQNSHSLLVGMQKSTIPLPEN